MSGNQSVIDAKVEHYLPQILKILERYFRDSKVKVYLYGSRARGDENSASDIDLAVQSNKLLQNEIAQAREAFFESHIPYKVDLVQLENVSDYLEKNIINEGLLIWES